jgi:hypothetical protein
MMTMTGRQTASSTIAAPRVRFLWVLRIQSLTQLIRKFSLQKTRFEGLAANKKIGLQAKTTGKWNCCLVVVTNARNVITPTHFLGKPKNPENWLTKRPEYLETLRNLTPCSFRHR